MLVPFPPAQPSLLLHWGVCGGVCAHLQSWSPGLTPGATKPRRDHRGGGHPGNPARRSSLRCPGKPQPLPGWSSVSDKGPETRVLRSASGHRLPPSTCLTGWRRPCASVTEAGTGPWEAQHRTLGAGRGAGPS